MNLFSKHAIAMVWDFAEANILGNSVGGWATCSDYAADCVEVLCVGTESRSGNAAQVDAASVTKGDDEFLISTDPPYYDNISYSSLSDFFYVWLRRTVGDSPRLMGTMLVTKIPELTASPEKFDADKQKAKEFFESGFRRAFADMYARLDPRFPLTVYYAFKQEDEEEGDENSGGVESHHRLGDASGGADFQRLHHHSHVAGPRASQKWRQSFNGYECTRLLYRARLCRPRPERTVARRAQRLRRGTEA